MPEVGEKVADVILSLTAMAEGDLFPFTVIGKFFDICLGLSCDAAVLDNLDINVTHYIYSR
jgi:hypothetical protein